MKYFAILIAVFISSSCSTQKERLIQTNSEVFYNARDKIENFKINNRNVFIFFDRESHTIYHIGNPFGGMNFREVNLDYLKRSNPDVFHFVNCVQNKNCMSVKQYSCKYIYDIKVLFSENEREKIVNTFQNRGYPVLTITFSKNGIYNESIEVEYFTECQFLEFDVRQVINQILR